MNVLIVDDEPIARRILRDELETISGVAVAGEAGDGREALQKIAALQPELVLLDLQMPVMSGFEVVRNLTGPRLPVIVIVTAFDQHAIQAFEAGAVDYLLKPVSESRLRKAVERARRIMQKPAEVAADLERIAGVPVPSPAERTRKIVGRNGSEYLLLNLDDVLAFQAERELVWIITPKGRLLAEQTLHAIDQRLRDSDCRQFQRIHRNAIVNVNHVRKLSALTSRWLITLSNALQFVVSKRQAHLVRNILCW